MKNKSIKISLGTEEKEILNSINKLWLDYPRMFQQHGQFNMAKAFKIALRVYYKYIKTKIEKEFENGKHQEDN